MFPLFQYDLGSIVFWQQLPTMLIVGSTSLDNVDIAGGQCWGPLGFGFLFFHKNNPVMLNNLVPETVKDLQAKIFEGVKDNQSQSSFLL